MSIPVSVDETSQPDRDSDTTLYRSRYVIFNVAGFSQTFRMVHSAISAGSSKLGGQSSLSVQ